jgi:plastocyanin
LNCAGGIIVAFMKEKHSMNSIHLEEQMKTRQHWMWIFVTMAGLAGVWGCSSNSTSPYSTNAGNSSGTNTTVSPNTIVLSNMSFGPSSLTVSKGTTVTFKNNDGIMHTATSDTDAWDSGNIPEGASRSVTFNTAGTFPYHCTVHPMMTATIVVQ